MNKIIKIISIFIFCIIFSSCSALEYYLQEEITTKETENQDPELSLFEWDKQINDFLIQYNSIAEYPISNSNVKMGNIRQKAHISIEEIRITIVNSDSISIKILNNVEKESPCLYPVFRDLLKSCDSSITNSQAKKAWSEVKEKYYSIDHSWDSLKDSYCLQNKNIQISYSKNLYNEITINLLVKK